MPVDYVPVLTSFKVTEEDPTPLQDRKNHVRTLYRGPAQDENAAISGMTDEDFEKHIQKLRVAAHKFGVAHSHSIVLAGIRAAFPHLRIDGREIATIEDFFQWVQRGRWNTKHDACNRCIADGDGCT